MSMIITMSEPGGLEVLHTGERAPQPPGAGELRIRHNAIGVNFIDIYHRKGIYPLPAYPAVPGVEAAGVVEAIGAGVEGWQPGDRVAYTGLVGAYAATRLIPAARALHVPENLDDETVAASLLKAMTAHMLIDHTGPIGPQTTVLVHAAAGGLGSLLAQCAARQGARVIGTVGAAAKEAAARANGATEVIVGRDADIVAEIARLTDGRGVDIVYDGIGGAMLARSLACTRPFGKVASIGQAAGPVPPVDIALLRPGKMLSAPSIMAVIAAEDGYRETARAALALMAQGITVPVAARYPLAQAAEAQAQMEAGSIAGGIVLTP